MPGPGHADEHVGARHDLVQRALAHLGVRVLGEPLLRRVEFAAAPGPDRALAVEADHVGHTGGLQDLGDRNAGRADAGDDDLEVFHLLVDDLERVAQRGERDDGGAVLVVVEDRDVEAGLEPLLDLEAARRGDVFEVDATEDGLEALDGFDQLVGTT